MDSYCTDAARNNDERFCWPIEDREVYESRFSEKNQDPNVQTQQTHYKCIVHFARYELKLSFPVLHRFSAKVVNE